MVNIKCPLTPCDWQSGELSEQLAFQLYEDHKKHVHDRSEQTEPPVTKGDNADNFQITRKFGKTAEPNLCYKTGSVIQHETEAGSSLEPAREFKLFNVSLTPQNIEDIRLYFIQDFAIFSNACLNRRCNGTMFFGVGNSNNKHEQLKHGQIVGISLDKSQVEFFEEWIQDYFRGKDPICYDDENEDFLRASMAISPLYPIRTDEGRYIFEIDVEPKSSFCKEIFFEVAYFTGCYNWESGYFVREGSQNIQYSDCQIQTYLDKDFRVYLDERRNLDEAALKKSDKLVKLQELFIGQDMVINDKDKKFYLFTDIVAEDICFWDTLAQVFKRKLMNNLKIKTLTVQEKNKVIEIARLSSKYFQHAQKLIENKFCRSRKRHNSSPHGHTNDFTNRNTSYFGKL